MQFRSNYGNPCKRRIHVNLKNAEVQQKLCTEPKTTVQEKIEFAIAYEEGTIRQKLFDKLEKIHVKTEAGEINIVNQSANKRWGPTKTCFRCEAPFSTQHLKECKAMGISCMKRGKMGHFAKCCQTKGAGNVAKSRKIMRPPQQQIQKIDEWDESCNGFTTEEDKLVLTKEGDENGQFTMSSKIKGNPFQTMVDSGLPVTLIEIDQIRRK